MDRVLSEQADNYRVMLRSQGWKQLLAAIEEEKKKQIDKFRGIDPLIVQNSFAFIAIQQAINAYEKVLEIPLAIIRLDDSQKVWTAKTKENDEDE